MMDRIICKVERDPHYRKIVHAEPAEPEATSADAVSAAVRRVTSILPVTATVAYTTSGSTSLRIARERPEAPILSLTVWGVHSVLTEDAKDVEDMVAKASRIALDEGFARSGRPLVIIAGMPFGTPGSTNLLRIAWAA